MTNSKTNKTLQIFTSIGAVLYLLFIAMVVLFDSYPIFKPFGLKEMLALIFIAGFALSWRNKNLAVGIIFMIWNAGVWVDDLYLNRPDMDYSMASAIATSFMLLGAFFLLKWYKTAKETAPSKKQQWKFILRVLLINYAFLYAIVAFSEPILGEPVNYLSFPFVIYPILLVIFLVGFLISWKKEIIAGYIFLFWFAILLIANIVFPEILKLGPWAAFGLPILFQGIIYITNHNSQVKNLNALTKMVKQ